MKIIPFQSYWVSLAKACSGFFILILFNLSVFSQRPITLSYVQDAKGNTIFSCNNQAWCNYVLQFDFTSLVNARTAQAFPYQAVIKPGLHPLFTLSRENPDNAIQFRYSINYFKGCLDQAADTGFTYLLPIRPGKEAQAYEIQNPPKPETGVPPVKSFYAIRLKMKPGDTLYAARRGRVIEVDVSSDLNDQGATSSGDEDYIEIVHQDCSFAHYGVLRKDGSLVRPGQEVEAGQPIGIIGGDRYGRGSEARISVFYNLVSDASQNNGRRNGTVERAYVPLKFWTKRNGKGMLKHGANYTSEFPPALHSQELIRSTPKKNKMSAPHHS